MAPEIQTTVMLNNSQGHHSVITNGKIFHSQVLSPLQLLYMILWLRYYTNISGVSSQPNTIHTATADSLHHAEISNLVVVLIEAQKYCFLWYLHWQFAIRVLLLHLSAWLEWRQGCSRIQNAV